MIRRPRPALILVAIAAVAAAGLPVSATTAVASLVQLEGLRLEGPSSLWQPTNSFTFTWKQPPPRRHEQPGQPYTVEYLIRDSASTAISAPARFTTATPQLPGVRIPAPAGLSTVPRGLYTIEVWAENSTAPHAFAALGFDDEAPGAARPIAPSEWLRAGSYAEIAIEHPDQPLPVSGIRGYAFLLDHSAAGEPCAGPDQCSEVETDLDAGIEDDVVRVGPLLEESNVVRVVAVSNSGIRSSRIESAPLRVDGTPPQISFGDLPGGWANQPVQVTATAVDPLSGTAPGGPEGPQTTLSVDDEPPTVAPGGRATAAVHGDGTHRVSATARDAVGNATDASQPATALLRIDETPPSVTFAAARDPAEPERIVAIVADALSGSAARGSIAVRPDGSSQRFQPLPTSVSGNRLAALWDSDSYPPGSYEFRVSGYDKAGNETISERRADGGRLVLPSPLKTPAALAFGFGGRQLVWHRCERQAGGLRCHRKVIVGFDRRPAARTVPFGHAIPVGGRLTSSSGEPLAGVEVEIGETFAAGSSPSRRTSTVVTGSDGTFLARLAPGPSRRISVGFAGTRQLTRAAGRDLWLGVRGRVRLRASTAHATIGGAPVAFSGQVEHQDAAIPSSGLAVELQFQVLGSPWSEFRTVQTDSYGRFSYPYSFSDDDSRGVRFQFRAVVPEQAGWPYESGASRPVAVTGR